MKFGDILDLAKQGYKPSDIKELLELSKAVEEKDTADPVEDNEQKNPVKDQDQVSSEGDAPLDTTAEDKAEAVDYKSLYEEEKTKNSTLQKMLRKVDMSGSDNNESDADIFAEALKNFM